MGTSYNPKIVTNGLILHLDAANRKSYPGAGTSWVDLSKNKYIGTMSNVTVDPSNGGCMSFNGTSSFISTNVASPGSMPITFEFWINSTTSTPGGIFDSAPFQQNVLRNANPNGYIEWWNASPSVNMGITANTWTHIVIVYRFATNRFIDFYRDGQFISTGTGSTTSTFAWTSLRFGDVNNGEVRYSGKIAVARIYNTILNSSNVLQNYNATKGMFAL